MLLGCVSYLCVFLANISVGVERQNISEDGEVKEYNSGRSKEDLALFMQRALYGEEADEMAPPNYGKKEEKGPPPFLSSRSIKQLSTSNFIKVIGNKETAALVFFYNPECLYCQSAKPHFLKAAKTTHIKNRIYATVDCTQEEALCEAENIRSFPTFKLYVGGRFLTKYNQSPNFNNFRNFVQNAPIDPKYDDGPDTRSSNRRGREDL